jgi:hypothetical protein
VDDQSQPRDEDQSTQTRVNVGDAAHNVAAGTGVTQAIGGSATVKVVISDSANLLQKARVESDPAISHEIDSLRNRLTPSDGPARRDWLFYGILAMFVVFCLVMLVSPFWLYEYSSRSPSSVEIQTLILTESSIMSGITGLLGVLIGSRIRRWKT